MNSPPQGSLNTSGGHLVFSLGQDGVFLSSHVYVLFACHTPPLYLHICTSQIQGSYYEKHPGIYASSRGQPASQPAGLHMPSQRQAGVCSNFLTHRILTRALRVGTENSIFSNGGTNVNSIWLEESELRPGIVVSSYFSELLLWH